MRPKIISCGIPKPGPPELFRVWWRRIHSRRRARSRKSKQSATPKVGAVSIAALHGKNPGSRTRGRRRGYGIPESSLPIEGCLGMSTSYSSGGDPGCLLASRGSLLARYGSCRAEVLHLRHDSSRAKRVFVSTSQAGNGGTKVVILDSQTG